MNLKIFKFTHVFMYKWLHRLAVCTSILSSVNLWLKFFECLTGDFFGVCFVLLGSGDAPIDNNKVQHSEKDASSVESKIQDKPFERETVGENCDNSGQSIEPSSSKESEEKSQPSQSCKLVALNQTQSSQISKGATFWPDGWRTKLCTCPKCKVSGQKLLITPKSFVNIE